MRKKLNIQSTGADGTQKKCKTEGTRLNKFTKPSTQILMKRLLDEYAKAISMGELTLKDIEEIHAELAEEKIKSAANLGVLETMDKPPADSTPFKNKERIEAVQALFTDVHYQNDKNNEHKDYIINSFVESDLELDQIKELTLPLRDSVKIDIKDKAVSFPGVQ